MRRYAGVCFDEACLVSRLCGLCDDVDSTVHGSTTKKVDDFV